MSLFHITVFATRQVRETYRVEAANAEEANDAYWNGDCELIDEEGIGGDSEIESTRDVTHYAYPPHLRVPEGL